MKTVKVSDLSGPALDWAVAGCESILVEHRRGRCYTWDSEGLVSYSPSSDWSMVGPIIEREGISTHKYDNDPGWYSAKQGVSFLEDGPTPLIAAMRCYVASKLGDAIEIPEELV